MSGWRLVPLREWMFWAPLTSMDRTPFVTAGTSKILGNPPPSKPLSGTETTQLTRFSDVAC